MRRAMPVPLTQRRMTDPTIITDATVVMAGPHDLDRLEAAAQLVCRAHEALRTTVDLDLDEQVVHEHRPAAVAFGRHTAGPGLLMEVLDERAKRPLDPAVLPVFRVEAVVESPLLLAVHLALPHAVADVTAMEVVVRDFVRCYRDLLAGQDPHPPEVTRQFSDYQQHCGTVLGDERTWRPGGAGARAADFWAARLDGAEPPAFVRMKPGSARGDRMVFLCAEFGSDLLQSLTEVCRKAGCSVFQAILAAFEESVARVTGQEDVTTICLVHGRGKPEFRDTVGLLIGEVAFRHTVRADSRLAYLSGLAVDAFTTYVHQEVPLAAVAVRSLEVGRFYQRYQFRYMCLQYRPQRFGAGLEDTIEGVRLSFPQTTRAMLASVMPGVAMFNVDQLDDRLTAELVYDSRRWRPEEMARLHSEFLSCLEAFALAPDDALRPRAAEPHR